MTGWGSSSPNPFDVLMFEAWRATHFAPELHGRIYLTAFFVGRTEGGLDQVDLLSLFADRLGAVPAAHHEFLDAGPDETAFDLEVRSALVILGIDHEDTRRADNDVVDVGARARDASVVEHLKGW